MGSELLNEDAATPCLLFCLQKYSLNNTNNLIESDTIMAQMMSEYNIPL
jgi:hypothetical protein